LAKTKLARKQAAEVDITGERFLWHVWRQPLVFSKFIVVQIISVRIWRSLYKHSALKLNFGPVAGSCKLTENCCSNAEGCGFPPPDSIKWVIPRQVLMKSCPLYRLKGQTILPSGVGDWIPNVYHNFSVWNFWVTFLQHVVTSALLNGRKSPVV
jgi:hypothetical protein